MKKIYFAPNWGLSPNKMVEDYIMQTPKNLGVWKDIQYTLDPENADFLIIQDSCNINLYSKFKKTNRLYFSREALTPGIISRYPSSEVVRSSFWDNSGILWTKWCYPNHMGINMSYDDLINEKPVEKTKNLTCIQSNKEMTPGHISRKAFLKKFINTKKEYIDLYGTIEYSNKILFNNNKIHGLNEYKYCLSFDNQNYIKDFFGTQVTDSMLRWCIPIYWGGGNLKKYFPEKSFIKIDINDKNCIDDLVNLIENDDYYDRINDLREARYLILNKYNMWPTIKGVIDNL